MFFSNTIAKRLELSVRLAVGAALLSSLHLASRAQVVDTVIATGLNEPYGIAIGEDNLHYITDGGNNRVAVFNPDTGNVIPLAGFEKGARDSEDGSTAQFYVPSGIALIPGGMVVSDTGNHVIRHITTGGRVTTLAGNIESAAGAHEVGLDPDNHSLRDGIGAAAFFHSPTGVTWDGGTQVYVADTGNDRIRIISLIDQRVTTFPVEFAGPVAITVTSNGVLYVAERDTHSIRRYVPGSTAATLLAGKGSALQRGYFDAPRATDALFNAPRGLLLNERKGELLVADTDNSLIRRIYNLGTGSPGVDTFSPPGAGFNAPVGLARDVLGSILVADVYAHKIRKIRVSGTPQPQIAPPQIGTVFPTDFCFATFGAVTNATFNNDVRIAISAERDTITYYTYGSTDQAESIPDPRPDNGAQNPPFFNNDDCGTVPENLLGQINPRSARLTIKAYSTQAERQPSKVIVANYIFQVANPVISGSDPTGFSMQMITTNAVIYYSYGEDEARTLDPSPGSSHTREYTPGSTLDITGNGRQTIFFKARAYRDGYLASSVVRRQFSVSNVQQNYLGFDRDFEAAAGASIVIPLELDMAASNVLQSAQFRIEARGNPKAPQISVLEFEANAFFPVNGPKVYPEVFVYPTSPGGSGLALVYSPNNATPFVISNSVTLALLRVDLPADALPGSTFQISVLNPSGTSDGQHQAVPMSAMPNRSIIIKDGLNYWAGDVVPASGYNAGEFGDDVMANNDYNAVLFAALNLRVPYEFTSLFNAMDVFPAGRNGTAGGDKAIRYQDQQLVLKRSLGLEPSMELRTWSGGALRGSGVAPSRQGTTPEAPWDRPVLMGLQHVGGFTQTSKLRMPIFVATKPGKQIAGLHFAAEVIPDEGQPRVQGEIKFIPAAGIPAPSVTGQIPGGTSDGVYASWNLGAFAPALQGSNILGYVEFSFPGTAQTGKSYHVKLVNADGSPDSMTQYDFETISGQAVVNGVAPARAPFLPAEWVEHFFPGAGAAPGDDPDQDGAPNWNEYLSGTDPRQNTLKPALELVAGSFQIKWQTHTGVKYRIESASAPSGPWSAYGTEVEGRGEPWATVTVPKGLTNKFFRIRTVTP